MDGALLNEATTAHEHASVPTNRSEMIEEALVSGLCPELQMFAESSSNVPLVIADTSKLDMCTERTLA